jgi:NAD(P)-dependent dehydrogenase (short-subunit alcohol dehydrogenase family)
MITTMTEKQTALILGATKGLGKEIADDCHRRGWNTIEIGSSNQDAVDGNRRQIKCDLADLNSVQRLVTDIESLLPDKHFPVLPKFNRFFWVAGTLLKGDFDEQLDEDIIKTVDVNFRNPILIAHAAWKVLKQSEGPSSFVTIASSSGKKYSSDEAVYAATKFAQVGLIGSLGMENINPNLRVITVLPGGMKTPFWNQNPTIDTESFLDPKKVAIHIMDKILEFDQEPHQQQIIELEIPRGSL